MKPFDEIIKEYPLVNSSKIKKILVANELYDIMQSTYSILSVECKENNNHFNFGSIVSNFVNLSSNKISAIHCKDQKKKIEHITLYLSEKFLMEFLVKIGKHPREIFPQIEEAIRTTCKQCNYSFLPYEKLFNYKEQSLLIKFDNEKDGSSVIIDKKIKCCSIHWLEKGKLFELVDILKKNKYIRRKKDLFAFFQSFNEEINVQWNKEKTYHMTYLLYRLFNENYARITGNRGYFRYAEMKFSDMEGIPFKPNSLKKISSKINTEKEKYSQIRKEVDGIIKRITKETNRL